jgi:DNA-binding protein YbaB
MKEQLQRIESAIDGVADELLENRRHGNMGDLVKVMKNINDNLVAISFDLKELVEQKKIQNSLSL